MRIGGNHMPIENAVGSAKMSTSSDIVRQESRRSDELERLDGPNLLLKHSGQVDEV